MKTENREILADMLETAAMRADLSCAGFVKDDLVGISFCTAGMDADVVLDEARRFVDFMKPLVDSEIYVDFLDFEDTATMQVFVRA